MTYQVIWDKIGGRLEGSLPTITQGSTLETLTILALYRDGTTIDLSSMTLSATMTDDNDDTTAVSGTLTGADGSFTWDFSAGDVGTAGTFTVYVTYTDGADSWVSMPVTITITENPAVDAVQNDALVGIPTDDAAWLAVAESTVADPSDLETQTGSQAKADAAIAALGGADGTVSNEQLRNWAGNIPALMTSVTRTDYSNSYTAADGSIKYVGFIAVTGTVTWPDGVTGHVDAIEYPESLGILQYFTASHLASGKIVRQSRLKGGSAGVSVVTPDYYVDSNAAGGGDGSLATPYNAFADLPALSANDVIAIKSNSIFYESLSTIDDISIYRYASGSKPLIDCSDAITAENWSKTGGQTNVYEVSITFEERAGGNQETLVLEDGTRLTRVADVATCDSTAGSYYPDSDTTSPATLYVHTTNSDNPETNGLEYRYSARVYAIAEGHQASSENLVIDGIQARMGSSDSGSITTDRSGTLRHCQIDEGGKHNLIMTDGATIEGCTFAEGYSTLTTSTIIVFNENAPISLGLTVRDSAFSNTVYDNTVNAIYCHSNVSGDFGDVLVSRVHVTNVGAAVELVDVQLVIIQNCYHSEGARFLRTQAAVTHTMTSTYFYSSKTNAQYTKTNLTGSTIVIRDGYAILDGAATGTGFCGNVHNDTTFSIYNTRLEQTTTGINPRECIYVSAGLTGVTLFVTGVQYKNWLRAINDFAATTTIASNNNQFCIDMRHRINNTEYNTIAAYQTATGFDMGSIIGGCS